MRFAIADLDNGFKRWVAYETERGLRFHFQNKGLDYPLVEADLKQVEFIRDELTKYLAERSK